MIRRLLLALLVLAAPLRAQPPDSGEVLRVGQVRIYHAPRHEALAREVAAVAIRRLPMPGLGRVAAPDSTAIVLAATPAMFASATGGGAPEWAGGVAIPDLRLIVLPVYPVPGVRPADAGATLRHEIAHLVVAERLPEPIPRWFTEGYAEVAAGSWDVESAWTLRVAFMLNRAPRLDSLALAWPRTAGRARLAYLLSATMVDHLRRRTGEEGFALLLQNWQREGTLDQAVRVTWGMTMGQLEDEWRKDVRRRYGWLSIAANLGIFWFVVMLVGFIALIPRRRRNRARMAQMERENLMLPPPTRDSADVEYPLAVPDTERD